MTDSPALRRLTAQVADLLDSYVSTRTLERTSDRMSTLSVPAPAQTGRGPVRLIWSRTMPRVAPNVPAGEWANPTGLCQCGCGEITNLVPSTITIKGRTRYLKGEHFRFVEYHGSRGRKLAPGPAEQLVLHRHATVNGCWEWTRHRNNLGYGVMSIGRRLRYAHIVSWELHHGCAVPAGLELDHLCRNPACFNPDHLEAVTRQENQRRGMGPSGINARKTHCIHGHLLTGTNVYNPPKRPHTRQCKTCARNRVLRRKAA